MLVDGIEPPVPKARVLQTPERPLLITSVTLLMGVQSPAAFGPALHGLSETVLNGQADGIRTRIEQDHNLSHYQSVTALVGDEGIEPSASTL